MGGPVVAARSSGNVTFAELLCRVRREFGFAGYKA